MSIPVRPIALAVLLVIGCGSPEPETPPATQAPRATQAPAPPRPSEPGPVEAPPPAPTCARLGLGAIEPVPTAAEDANRRGLRAHAAGDVAASSRLFSEALALHPGYAAARFNLACAEARAGRVEEARRHLLEVLCAELPEYASRAASDPDLQPLRDASPLAPVIDTIAAESLALAARGTPAVIGEAAPRDEDGRASAWAQAGAWVHAERRFVPMGPRVRSRVASDPALPIAATRYDPERRRVLAVSAHGNDSEGGLATAALVVRVHRAPTGELELDSTPRLGETYGADVLVADDGVLVRGFRHPETLPTFAITASGTTRWTAPIEGDVLRIGMVSWRVARETPGFEHRRGALITPDGEHSVPLHRVLSRRDVHVDRASAIALAVSSASGDCGYADRYAIERVDLRTGAVSPLDAGEGQPIVEIGRDGALYLQIHDRVLRFQTPRSATSEVLPPGILLSTQPDDVNPYC